MTTPHERLAPEEHHEIKQLHALVGNIDYLLFKESAVMVPLLGKRENGKQVSVKVLGGSLKTGEVRPAQIGFVHVESIDLLTGDITAVSTTVSIDRPTAASIDRRSYRLEGNEVRRIDENQEDSGEEDALQTMFDIVSPHPDRVNVAWSKDLARPVALEQIEANWDLDWVENY